MVRHRFGATDKEEAERFEKYGPRNDDEIGHFFAEYPQYEYSIMRPIWDEFRGLCTLMNWTEENPKDRAFEEAKKQFRLAMVREFNRIFGKDRNSMKGWASLCRMSKIAPIPPTLEERQEKMLDIHINICALLGAFRVSWGEVPDVVVYPHLEGLKTFTKNTGWYFPKEEAKSSGGGLLRYLLRKIHGSAGENDETNRRHHPKSKRGTEAATIEEVTAQEVTVEEKFGGLSMGGNSGASSRTSTVNAFSLLADIYNTGDQSEMDRMIREMEEEDARRGKAQQKYEEKKKAEKEAQKLRDEESKKSNAAEEDRKLKEAELAMDALEDEKERKRLAAEKGEDSKSEVTRIDDKYNSGQDGWWW